MKRFIISTVLALLTLTSCGKSENTNPSNADSSKKEDIQSNSEQKAQNDAAKSPEELEVEWASKALKITPIEDSDELKALKQKAETGDEAAYEALGLYYAKLPKSRASRQAAREAFKHVKKHSIAEAAFLRGKDEFFAPGIEYLPDELEKAAAHIHAAAEMDNIDALSMVANYTSLVMENVDVVDKINKYYAIKSANSRDPEALYEWSKALEGGVYDVSAKDTDKLMREAAEKGYSKALVQNAEMLMGNLNNTKLWKQGFEQMQKVAESGNSDANSRLALFLIQYKTNTEHEGLSTDIVSIIDAFIENSNLSIDELALKYVTNGLGYEASFQVLNYLSEVNAIDKSTVVNLLKQQIDVFSKQSASRDACDLTMSFPWKPMHERKFLSDDDFQQVGQKVVNCYKEALERGDDWRQGDAFSGSSTAVALAEHYSGKGIFSNSRSADVERNYLAFGAIQGNWDAQWMLANLYRSDSAMANPERACFWNKKASENVFCSKVCKSPAAEYVEDCSSCESILNGLKSCGN